MEKKQMDLELVQNYLEGNLTKDERITTNQRLVDDSEFRKLLDHMELMIEGIRSSGSKTLLQEKIEQLESALETGDAEDAGDAEDDNIPNNDVDLSHTEETKVVYWYSSPMWKAIAASIVLIMAVWLAFNYPAPMSNEKIAENYLIPYKSILGSRGTAESSLIDKAYEAYGIGNYERAVVLFEQKAEISTGEITDLFYLGNAYLQTGNPTKAISTFQKVIDFRQGWVVDSKWYMAFAYLELGDDLKAKELFVEIRDGGEEFVDYREEAEKVLKNLN